MFLTIKFILDCNTLTSFERTSSSWVHCSNGQNGPGSFGAPTIQNGYFWAPRGIPAVPEFWGALGAPRYPKSPALLPGESSRLILQRSIKATTRFLGQERRKGKGLLLPTTPPRAHQPCANVKRARGRWIQTKTFKSWRSNQNIENEYQYLVFSIFDEYLGYFWFKV